MKMSIIVMLISLMYTISEDFNAKTSFVEKLWLKTRKLTIFDEN